MAEATVGHIVHYTDNPNAYGGHPRCRAAIVVNVNPDGTVDLCEFVTPSVQCPVYAVEQGLRGELYRWHWAERVED